MAKATGSCLCGAVTFEADDADPHYEACHCGMCRKWTGGPSFSTEAGGLRFDGEENITRYSSSEWGERGFCRVCGSSLFFRLKPAGKYFVSLGTFDDRKAFQFATEIYIDHKPADYDFAGERPRLTEKEVLAKFSSS